MCTYGRFAVVGRPPSVAHVIQLRGVSKRYGATTAVSDLSFDVLPGHVTGFLGPNGAGKSTTMRVILGLDAPDEGSAVVNGRPYRALRRPLLEVGAVLDARAVQGGRRARHHLLALARSNGIPAARVDQVLTQVGLESVADRRVGGFSLGMSQRLGIAAALLGDPPVLLFDEPLNGLDPEGIRWIRHLMQELARQGRTVLVSSHLMSEMELTADRVVVIGKGTLLADTTMAAFLSGQRATTIVRSPEPDALIAAVERAGGTIDPHTSGVLRVTGLDLRQVGDAAWRAGVPVHELSEVRSRLEEVFSELTIEQGVFTTHDPTMEHR